MVAAAAIVLPASMPGAAAAKTTITASGSTTVAPLFALLAKKYVKKKKGKVGFRLLQGGSDTGVADVAADRVDIGNSSRDPREGDPGGITFHKIALDALCIATNNANGIGEHGHRDGSGRVRRRRARMGVGARRHPAGHDRPVRQDPCIRDR